MGGGSVRTEEISPDSGWEAKAARDRICRKVIDALKMKEYGEESMECDKTFVLTTDEGELQIPIDVLVCLDRRPVLLTKCVRGHLSTRERAALSLARILGDDPIPFAIVANETDAVVCDGITGKAVGHGYGAFPSPASALKRARESAKVRIPAAQREREKRILLTYYHLRCSVDLEPF